MTTIHVATGYTPPLPADGSPCPRCDSYARAKMSTGWVCWACYVEARLHPKRRFMPVIEKPLRFTAPQKPKPTQRINATSEERTLIRMLRQRASELGVPVAVLANSTRREVEEQIAKVSR